MIPAEGLGDRLGEEISGSGRGVQQRRSSKLVDWSALSSRGSDWSQEFDVKTTQNGVKMTQNVSKNGANFTCEFMTENLPSPAPWRNTTTG